MRYGKIVTLASSAVLLAGIVFVSRPAAGKQPSPGKQPPPSQPMYNPYPPGILPADLDSEVARVQREINFIFTEAKGEWQALPPPNPQGNPPTLQGSGYQAVEVLGKLMNFDLNISPFRNEICASCH